MIQSWFRLLLAMKAMVALDVSGDGNISKPEFERLGDAEVISEAQTWKAEL